MDPCVRTHPCFSSGAQLLVACSANRPGLPQQPFPAKTCHRSLAFPHRRQTQNSSCRSWQQPFVLNLSSQWPFSAASAESSKRPLQHDDYHYETDNLLVYLAKNIFSDLKGVVKFLWEQPGELKFLEFPSPQSAVKMALFTLAVVMVLIVFLATIDSAFSYILAMVLRRVR